MLAVHTPNRLERQLERLSVVPAFARPWFRSVVLGRAVPFTGTAKLRYEEMSASRVQIFVRDQRASVYITTTHHTCNQAGNVKVMGTDKAAVAHVDELALDGGQAITAHHREAALKGRAVA